MADLVEYDCRKVEVAGGRVGIGAVVPVGKVGVETCPQVSAARIVEIASCQRVGQSRGIPRVGLCEPGFVAENERRARGSEHPFAQRLPLRVDYDRDGRRNVRAPHVCGKGERGSSLRGKVARVAHLEPRRLLLLLAQRRLQSTQRPRVGDYRACRRVFGNQCVPQNRATVFDGQVLLAKRVVRAVQQTSQFGRYVGRRQAGGRLGGYRDGEEEKKEVQAHRHRGNSDVDETTKLRVLCASHEGK